MFLLEVNEQVHCTSPLDDSTIVTISWSQRYPSWNDRFEFDKEIDPMLGSLRFGEQGQHLPEEANLDANHVHTKAIQSGRSAGESFAAEGCSVCTSTCRPEHLPVSANAVNERDGRCS